MRPLSPPPAYEPLGASDPEQLGEYFLIGRLGRGGQGVVYLGRATDGRWVAVKALQSAVAEDSHARARFGKEIAAAKRIGPAFGASVLDFDLEHDPPYVVSAYVAGPSLSQLVKRGGPISFAELTGLALGLATALAAVHRANVVHRDLKPSNVLLGPDGPRIVDFGIAHAMDATATVTGAVIGTPAYMAPEQFLMRQESSPDHWSGPDGIRSETDCWAWAATIVYAGLGRPPFGEDLRTLAHRVLHGQADLGNLPMPLRGILQACFALHPGDRPSAEQLVDHLRHGTVPVAPREKRASRVRVLAIVVAAASAAVAISAGGLWIFGRTIKTNPAADSSRNTAPAGQTAARPSTSKSPATNRATKPATRKPTPSGPVVPGVHMPRAGALEGIDTRLVNDPDGPVTLYGFGPYNPNFFPSPFYQWNPQTGGFTKTVSGLQVEPISPGGRWLAIVPQFQKPPTELSLIDRADGSGTPINIPNVQVHSPQWSKDGRRLLLSAADDAEPTRSVGFIIVDIERANAPLWVRQVPGAVFYWDPATGNVVSNRDSSAGSDLLAYRPDGQSVRVVPDVGQLAGNGLGPVSPDGKRLLTFCSNRRSACIRSASTGKLLRKLSFGGDPGFATVGWYDNTHHLMSLKDDKGRWHVAVVSTASDPLGTARWLTSGRGGIVFLFRQAPT